MSKVTSTLMKNIYILTLILFIISCGEKVRVVTEKFKDGKISTLRKFIDVGSKEVMVQYISYFPDDWGDCNLQSSDIMSMENYNIQGEKDGTWIYYDWERKDPLLIKINYKNGKKDGKYNTYNLCDMEKTQEGYYKDGESIGKWTKYFCCEDSNKISLEINYIDSTRISYFRNGKKHVEQGILIGKEGKFIGYHKNSGKIRVKGYYKDGEKIGKWNWYYEDGEIKEEQNYINGKKDGKWTYYNEDGSIERVEEWKDGQLIEK